MLMPWWCLVVATTRAKFFFLHNTAILSLKFKLDMLATLTLLLQVYRLLIECLDTTMWSLEVAGRLSISSVESSQAAVCVHKEQYQEILCKPQHRGGWSYHSIHGRFNPVQPAESADHLPTSKTIRTDVIRNVRLIIN